MVSGLIVDGMVVGGPAFLSHKLERGDEIHKVDGEDVTEDDWDIRLIGDDIPGTHVVVTVKKAETVRGLSANRRCQWSVRAQCGYLRGL